MWFWKKFWSKGLPYKIYILLWGLRNLNLEIDDIGETWVVSVVSRCNYYDLSQQEMVKHLFLIGQVVQVIWDHFIKDEIILGLFIQVNQDIT